MQANPIPTIPAKTILSGYTNQGSWFGANYNMNLYKGCCHGCIYCDSRSECYHIENFDCVRVKENALSLLEWELSHKRKAGIVMTGAMCDHYTTVEQSLGITRGALRLLDKYGYGVHISTKSTLVLRDIDLLQAVAKHSPAVVSFTITTYDDALCKKLEPNVALSSERFAAIKALCDAGITTGVLLMPILPFVNDQEENILSIVKKTAECGGKYIFAYCGFGVTLRQNQREYFLEHIEALFPGMRKQYEYQFGESYACASPRNAALLKLFCESCKKYGLAYKMEDIIELIHSDFTDGQLSLF